MARHRPERVAVEVDHAFGQRETVPERGEAIAFVQRGALLSRHSHEARGKGPSARIYALKPIFLCVPSQ